MPKEFDDGEGERWSEEVSEELEDLRERIKELCEESADDEEDHSLDTENVLEGSGVDQQYQPQEEETMGVVGRFSPSDETQGFREGAEARNELLKSESVDDRYEELEQLRARVNEEHYETDSGENEDLAVGPDSNDERGTPEAESAPECATLDDPPEERQLTEQSNQEAYEAPHSGEEVAVPPWSKPERPAIDSKSQPEEWEEEKSGHASQHEEVDQNSRDSEPNLVLEPSDDAAEKIEDEEVLHEVDADATSVAEAEGTPFKAVPEESDIGSTENNGESRVESPVNSNSNLGNESVEGWESERSLAMAKKDAELIETVREEVLVEPDSTAPLSRQNEEVGKQQDGVEARTETHDSDPIRTEGLPASKIAPEELRRASDGEIPPLVQDKIEIVQEECNEARHPSPAYSRLVSDIVAEPGIDSKGQGGLHEPVSRNIQHEENVVSRGILDIDLGSPQPQEVSQELINRSLDPATRQAEAITPMAASDGGAYLHEVAGLSTNGMGSRVPPADTNGRGNVGNEQSETEIVKENGSPSANEPRESLSSDAKSTDGQLGEGRGPQDDSGQKAELKLGSVGELRLSAELKATKPVESDLVKRQHQVGVGAKGGEIDSRDEARCEENVDNNTAHTELRRPPVLIESTVYRNIRDGVNEPYLMILKREIEDRTGVTLERGSTYLIQARINDSIELNARRIMTENRFIKFYPPKEHTIELMPGDKCVIAVTSIEQISQTVYRGSQNAKSARELSFREGSDATIAGSDGFPSNGLGPFKVTSKAYQIPGDNSKTVFRIWKPRIERENGTRFGRGKVYDIEGRIGNVCDFKTWHTETGRDNYFPIHVPQDSLTKVTPGEKYQIRIDSIRERTRHPLENRSEGPSIWDWKMVAVWIDTEGTYYGKGNSSFCVTISQKERGSLEGITDFLARKGIDSVIHKQSESDNYYLKTKGGIESLARIIVMTEPYITTSNKKAQIEAFRAELAKPKKIVNYHRKNAQRIMGLEESAH